jgi:hypothetical protein
MKRRFKKRWVVMEAEWSPSPRKSRIAIFRKEADALVYLSGLVRFLLLSQFPGIPENTRLALLQQIHAGATRDALDGFLEAISGEYGGRDSLIRIEEAREYGDRVQTPRPEPFTVSRSTFQKLITGDLDDPNFTDMSPELREQAERDYHEGRVVYVSVRAQVDLQIPNRDGGYILHQITTPGVWQVGVRGNRGRRDLSTSDENHLQGLFENESNRLATMLETMGMQVVS